MDTAGPGPGTSGSRRDDGESVSAALIGTIGGPIDDGELPDVLHGVVDAARELVGACYAALGLLDATGRELDRCVTAGPDDARPVPPDRIGADPRSASVAADSPESPDFLDVPVRVRDRVLGNLHLVAPAGGRFSARDERVVSALAAVAGVAIENARLFTRAARRQHWLEASTLITRQLLTEVGEDSLTLTARVAREVAAADLVTVVLPGADPDMLVVEVGVGDPGVPLVGYTYPRPGSLVGRVLDLGRPVSLPDARHGGWPWHQLEALEVGPVMVVPLAGGTATRGALALGRLAGGAPFDDDDLEMAGAFANQAALALELADARAIGQRMDLLEERDRIARDLHDHVIQRLFAAGLRLDGLATGIADAAHRARLSDVIDDLDVTIGQIRTAVFDLRVAPEQGRSPRRQILDIVAEVGPLLPRRPEIRFEGPIDTVLHGGALSDALAAVRESLTNIGRHARATRISLVLGADASRAELVVEDDGVGLGGSTRRSGLANLAARAASRGGSLATATAGGPAGREGTRLTWTIGLT